MSFQAYIDNIKAKAGKSPEDFKKLAEEKGFLLNGQIVKTVKAKVCEFRCVLLNLFPVDRSVL
jgi:hypothetical protein